MRHLYFDKHGNPASAELALDAEGILRDGFSQRTPLMLRDGQSVYCRDQGGTAPEYGCRPGFRLSDNAEARDAKQQAYDAYQFELENAWRIGDKKKFTVRNRRGGEEETIEETGDDDEDAVLEAVQNSGVERAQRTDANEKPTAAPTKQDGMTTDQIAKSHAANMERIYRERDAADASAWRGETNYE